MRSCADQLLSSKRVTNPPFNLLSTSNGKFQLDTDQDWIDLRNALAKDYRQGSRNFLVESKTPVFPFFLDIDFAHPTLRLEFVEGPLMSRIMRGVADALSPVLPVTSQQVLVAAAPPKSTKDGMVKTGVHLHWQWVRINEGRKVHLACTPETAMGIRAVILDQLSAMPAQDPPLKLEDVVDPRVLDKNGCRMLFSGKSTPCEPCRRLRRDSAKELPCQSPEGKLPTWRCRCPNCCSIEARVRVSPLHRPPLPPPPHLSPQPPSKS